MNRKVSVAYNRLSAGPKKEGSNNIAKQQVQSSTIKQSKSPNPDDIVVDVVTIQRTVKRNSNKPTEMAGTRQTSRRTPDEKKTSVKDNWCKVFTEQNYPIIKQGVQRLAGQLQSSRNSRHGTPQRPETKNSTTSRKLPKKQMDTKILDEIPVKQSASKPSDKSKRHSNTAIPSSTTISSSNEYVEYVDVSDMATQCGGIFDSKDELFSNFNPVRTLGFLMREMEGLIRDEKSSNILTQMEHALCRIPPEPRQPAVSNGFIKDMQTKRLLEASAAKLEADTKRLCEENEFLQQQVKKKSALLEDSIQRERSLERYLKQIKIQLNEKESLLLELHKQSVELCETQQRERSLEKILTQIKIEYNQDKETLQQLLQKQAVQLSESQQREKSLAKMLKQTKIDLNEALKSEAESSKTASVRKDIHENSEATQELINNLRRELNEQIEVAEKRYMEVQYLKLEKDKLETLLSYKDSVIKKLYSEIPDLIVHIREAGKYANEALSAQHASIIHNGLACSSPTSSNSNISMNSASGSDVSLTSAHDCDLNAAIDTNKSSSKDQVASSFLNGLLRAESETKKFSDKTQLEFISLPGEEVSFPVSIGQRKDEEIKSTSSEKRNSEPKREIKKLNKVRSVPILGRRGARDSFHRVETDNKESRPKSKTRKSSNVNDKQRAATVSRSLTNSENFNKPVMERVSGDPAISIKEQLQLLFDDVRQSKFPVHVPSPPRDYPRADWTDSSLPTISGISESQIV